MPYSRTQLANSEYAYLQRTMPHPRGLYRLVFIAAAVSLIPWVVHPAYWYLGHLLVMTVSILGLYWALQIRLMKTAVHLTRHPVDLEPNEMLGTLPLSEVYWSQIRAILRYYRRFLILNTLILLNFSVMLTEYFYYFNWDGPVKIRGIVNYIAIVHSAYGISTQWEWPYFPYFEYPATIFLAAGLLFLLLLGASILSINLGFWRAQQVHNDRTWLAIPIVAFCLFFVLFLIRNTPEWYCERNWFSRDVCADRLFRMRAIDSVQAIAFTYIDGGAVMLTGIHLPAGSTPDWEAYQWRNLLNAIVALFSQLALSAFFLWRSHLEGTRNTTAWLYGGTAAGQALWRYR